MSASVLRDHLIWAMVHAFDEGKGIEAQSLLNELKGLGPEQAAWQPPGTGPSIWTSLNHVAVWEEKILKLTRGERVDFNSAWPQPDEITQQAWKNDVEHLKAIHAKLIAHLNTLSDGDLTQQVLNDDSHDFDWAMAYTGLVVHMAYHTGQIRMLKLLQGVEEE